MRLRDALDRDSSARVEANEGLVVRLAFGANADLDLFVTDPGQEAVYFANSPSRRGGELVVDRRCGDPAPRVEVVHYSSPMAGRYRVGVDFPEVCDDQPSASDPESASLKAGRESEELYVVRVEVDGRVLERVGRILLGEFEVVALEFDVESIGSGPDAPAKASGPAVQKTE